ncbi:hypothetical protein [Clostridium estertheticum]|uniref:hypothetical protein n=1 Tax=Clostridium estertheticum TaxID=238834 RepID=UPI001C7CCFC2|nr:hypothetical protein [Clostridium estertheticum]MBX4267190.1 hypothetical protein [Clostridium estertheticum]MBX4272066.1 hypothetical protein [Clostridium estertheticum]WLC82438.1 hypothetical protein KTC98_23970 [Clostridium estertheticum]WLC91312.1 hypothetical protein KTC95_23940 [Clostridium estertheticum]
MNINKKVVKSIVMVTTLIGSGSIPAHAAINELKVDGMDNVASSLQNFIKYIGLFFVAAGAVTAFYGAYKLFQSIKSQDSESRSTSILEIASGLGAIAVGAGASVFSAYIKL